MGAPKAAQISRHLVAVSTAVRRRIREGLLERGHRPSLAISHVVPNLPPEGLGMSALAERAGLSLQRAGQLVEQLEDDRYVERVVDERDGRARRVLYTRRGERLRRDIDELMDEVSVELAESLGKRRFEELLRSLADLDVALNGERTGVRNREPVA